MVDILARVVGGPGTSWPVPVPFEETALWLQWSCTGQVRLPPATRSGDLRAVLPAIFENGERHDLEVDRLLLVKVVKRQRYSINEGVGHAVIGFLGFVRSRNSSRFLKRHKRLKFAIQSKPI